MLDKKLTEIFDKAREKLLSDLGYGSSFDLVISRITFFFIQILRDNPGLYQWQGLGEDLFLQTRYLVAAYNKKISLTGFSTRPCSPCSLRT